MMKNDKKGLYIILAQIIKHLFGFTLKHDQSPSSIPLQF